MKTSTCAIMIKHAAFNAAIFMPAVVLGVAFSSPAMAQQRVPCTGPMAQCYTDVGAWCEREADGRTKVIYYDRPGSSAQLENCVGKVFEAHGRPNPYKPAPEKPAPKPSR